MCSANPPNPTNQALAIRVSSTGIPACSVPILSLFRLSFHAYASRGSSLVKLQCSQVNNLLRHRNVLIDHVTQKYLKTSQQITCCLLLPSYQIQIQIQIEIKSNIPKINNINSLPQI